MLWNGMSENWIIYNDTDTNNLEIVEDGFTTKDKAEKYFKDHNLKDEDCFILQYK